LIAWPVPDFEWELEGCTGIRDDRWRFRHFLTHSSPRLENFNAGGQALGNIGVL
jgi:hypothetical protein